MRISGRLAAIALILASIPALAADAPLLLATLEFPPYISDTGQGAQGLAVSIVKAVFTRIGTPVRIVFYPITRGQSLVLSGDVDGFFSIKKTPEREQGMLFPQEALFRQDFVFFVRKNSSWHFDGNLDSIAAARIGVVGKTSYGERFDSAVKAGRFRLLDTAVSHEMNFRKLLAGRVDAVICSRLVGLYFLRILNAADAVNISGPTVDTTSSYLAFTRKKDFTQLARRFDQALDDMEHDGTLERLSTVYQSAQRLAEPGGKGH
ncbi:substrate-binding periplasmic protein [Paludibacterium yongneupense]|uniref:substrate-binding periplasmic protein n=1 Tax=Paludibacterium yongneupense TaxID=400061 RepID=UPI00040DA8A4|nr:transporter substrate-binding domain-containing protein [Paludibacterium yongneupense]